MRRRPLTTGLRLTFVFVLFFVDLWVWIRAGIEFCESLLHFSSLSRICVRIHILRSLSYPRYTRTRRQCVERINYSAFVPLSHVWLWFHFIYCVNIPSIWLKTVRCELNMSVLSKCFNHVLSTVNCHEIVHPHTTSCMHSALTSFWKPVPTTAKFFFPLFLVTPSLE